MTTAPQPVIYTGSPEVWVNDVEALIDAMEGLVGGVTIRVLCVMCGHDTSLACSCYTCGRFICNDCASHPLERCKACEAGTPTMPVA